MKELEKHSDAELFDRGLQIILQGLTSVRKRGRPIRVRPAD